MIGRYHSLLRGIDYLVSNGALTLGTHNAIMTGTYILVKDLDLASYIRNNLRGNIDVDVTMTKNPQRILDSAKKRNASIVILDNDLQDMRGIIKYLNENHIRTLVF